MGTVVEDILGNRAGKHGEFNENSTVTWQIMRVLMAQRNWPTISDGQRHALYMIAHKMARIIVGDPNEQDHWDDTAGYATLVADRLRNDIPVFDINTDYISAMSLAWNVPREEAKRRLHAVLYEEDMAKISKAVAEEVEAEFPSRVKELQQDKAEAVEIPAFMKKWGESDNMGGGIVEDAPKKVY